MHRLGQINHKVASLGHNGPKSKVDPTFKKSLKILSLKSPKSELFRKIFDMSDHIKNQDKKWGSIT